MRYTAITPTEFAALVAEPDSGLDGWRYSLGKIRTQVDAPSYTAGGAFLAEIAQLADEMDHHPELNLRWKGRVRITVSTHDIDSDLSDIDVEFARAVNARAAELGYPVSGDTTQTSELAIDTADLAKIKPFWLAVLDYRNEGGDDGHTIIDPRGEGPGLWFQTIEEGETLRSERGRFHWDVSVPHDQADARLAAALAAGGTLLSDARARAFWVLADAEGNECCICTWEDRG